MDFLSLLIVLILSGGGFAAGYFYREIERGLKSGEVYSATPDPLIVAFEILVLTYIVSGICWLLLKIISKFAGKENQNDGHD
jgi:hypothetical protein